LRRRSLLGNRGPIVFFRTLHVMPGASSIARGERHIYGWLPRISRPMPPTHECGCGAHADIYSKSVCGVLGLWNRLNISDRIPS
jgi:hypothetical protein